MEDRIYFIIDTWVSKSLKRKPLKLTLQLQGLFSVKNQKKLLALNNFVVSETKSGHPNKHLFSLTFRELNG